jgi:aspartate-semialdehyde dehydrogenase
MFYLQYAFNLFSHNAPILSNGYNEEEMKLVKETRKIWVSFKGYFFYYTVISNKIYYGLILYKMFPYFFLSIFQNDMNVKVTATCIRVPVMRAHAESINLQFQQPLDEVSRSFDQIQN